MTIVRHLVACGLPSWPRLLPGLLVAAALLPAVARAQDTSRDITAPLTGSGDMVREVMRRNAELIDERAEAAERGELEQPGVTLILERPGGGAMRGNLEHKVEIGHEMFDSQELIPISRVKPTFFQGHFNHSRTPHLWTFVHVAREWIYENNFRGLDPDTSNPGLSNTIVEINPRYQKEYGGGIWGVEASYGNESRFYLTRARIRPFIDARLTDDCRAFASGSGGYTLLENPTGEPDFVFGMLEAGARCFVGPKTIVGAYGKAQRGWNFDDDEVAAYLDDTPVGAWGLTKRAHELRAAPFIHHRFNNSIGLTAWFEVAQVRDDAENDNFFYQDTWTRGVAFVEYPVRPELVVYVEVQGQYGRRVLTAPAYDSAAFGFADDVPYRMAGAMLGLNRFF